MNPIIEKILARGPVVTDGAWGTQLQARGLEPGECPDAWNLSRPEKVEEIARAYTKAGSRIILTNTFGANRITLAKYGLAEKAAEINRQGATISQRGTGGQALVFASIGPTGKMLLMGEVEEEELRAAFAEQAQALKEGGADGLVVETMSDPAEAKVAVAAARETGLPVVGCMSFDSGKNKDRSMMGTTIEQAVEALTEAGADVIGANCGQGIEGYIHICQRLRAAASLPIWIKANAGLPEIENGRTVYKRKPEEFAAWIPELLKSGASFIGGCCGTSPEFIKAVKKALAAALP
ncbi:MAG: homocysteine S-methyltransferase family protein [Candidatus Omnitrophota bacterium]